MTIENLLSFYLNMNIVLAIAAVIWLIARSVWSRGPLKHAYLPQLRLVYGVLLSVALSPLIFNGVQMLSQSGFIARDQMPNFADFAVAQFLDGNIDMAPARFESLLMLRTEFINSIATLSSPLSQAIAAVLLLMTTFGVVRLINSGACVARTIGRSYLMRRVGRVDIRITHEVAVPFSTRGLWRHYIVLPTSLLSQSNHVRIAVAHELQHIRQGDLIWEILLEAARPIFFWNPAFGFLKREVEKLRELSCDQQVLRNKGLGVRDYCECLLRVCRNSLRLRQNAQLRTPSVPFAQLNASRTSANFLKHRVAAMFVSTSRDSGGLWVASFAMVVFLLVVLGGLLSQPANDWTQDRLMLSSIVNLERLDLRNSARY